MTGRHTLVPIAAATAVLALAGAGTGLKASTSMTAWHETAHDAHRAHVAHVAHRKHAAHLAHLVRIVTIRYYGDCEDQDGRTPCVTWDKGGWRLVTSYAPYRYVALNAANTEDGSPVAHLPAVWDSESMGSDRQGNGPAGRYIVFTLAR